MMIQIFAQVIICIAISYDYLNFVMIVWNALESMKMTFAMTHFLPFSH